MMTQFQVEANPDQSTRTERPKQMKFGRPTPPSFANLGDEAAHKQDRLVLACRIMAREGFEFTSTCLTSRDPTRRDSLWTVPPRLALSCISLPDLIQLSFDGEVLTPGARGAEYDIGDIALHAAVYRARDDVGAVITTNGPAMRGLSMGAAPFRMLNQDAATFYASVAALPSSLTDLTGPMRNAKVAILAHRGGMSLNTTIEGAIAFILRLETCCEAQLLGEAAVKGRGGQLVEIDDEAAAATERSIANPHHAWSMGKPNFAREERYMREESVAA